MDAIDNAFSVTKVARERKGLLVKLPEKIANFYQIQKKEIMQVFLNNQTLLTVIGTVQGSLLEFCPQGQPMDVFRR